MANGYERGDYLSRFLQQLPQIYAAQQNMKLQRERFEHAKEQDYKDDIYRSQVVQTNEERNRLARLDFEERQAENTRRENQRIKDNAYNEAVSKRADFELEASVQKVGTPAWQKWLLGQDFVKEDPALKAKYEQVFTAQDDLRDQIFETLSMEPLDRLPALRRLALNRNQTNEDNALIRQLIKEAKEETQASPLEQQSTMAYKMLENERKLFMDTREAGPQFITALGRSETKDEHAKKLEDILANITSYEKDVMEEIEQSRGKYPGLMRPPYESFTGNITYDSVEDVPDSEVDAVLGELGSTTVEAGAISPVDSSATQEADTSRTITTSGFTLPEGVPERPSTAIPPYDEDTLGVPADMDVVPPEDYAAFMPARDYSAFTKEEMKKYGRDTAYTGKDARERGEVDFYFDLLKENKISRKRFFDALKKANVNIQSVDLNMVMKHAGKKEKKQLSEKQKNEIQTILGRIEQLKTRNFSKKVLEDKINRQRNKILRIDPNYKFKD